MKNEKAMEQKLRRQARAQGLNLKKSRTRNPDRYSHGTYGLVDYHTNAVVFGNSNIADGFGMSLEECADFLGRGS